MTHRFAELMFTPGVKRVQETMGSRGAYERFEEPDAPARDRLTEGERAFIAARDSFYMATVSETGWPYVQHRGGPPGFLKVLDDRTLGFADYRGNRQYVSVGNLRNDDRVSLILVDYPARRRLKILGHARIVELASDHALIERLRDLSYDARIERGMVISIEGFDWNCPQHITPRCTQAQIAESIAPLVERLRAAEGRQATPAASNLDRLGEGPLALVVTGVRQLTPRVRAYELRSSDGSALPPARPGAHLKLPVNLDGRLAWRNYSLSTDPIDADRYEIAVLADGDGSKALHRDYAIGLRLDCPLPVDAFSLHDDARPALLIAGGIGITPIRAMAERLLDSGRPFRLHYAARSASEAAYLGDLRRAFGKHLQLHIGRDRRLDIGATLADADPYSVVYACGPQHMIDAVRKAAAGLGWAADRVRFERFAACEAAAGDHPFDLVLVRSGKRVEVGARQSALDALELAGVDVPSSCRTGACGTCRITCLGGEPDHRDSVLGPENRAAGGFTPCVSRALGAELLIDL